MHIQRRTCLAHMLTCAACSGDHHDITCETIWEEMDKGTILPFLGDRLDISPWFICLTPIERLELELEWSHFRQRGLLEDPNGRDNGLCMLVCYLLLGIERSVMRSNYGLTPKDYDGGDVKPEAIPVRRPTGLFCTTCQKPWDPMLATADTGRDSLCLRCAKRFCEFCLWDHQKTTPCGDPFRKLGQRADDGSDSAAV